MKRFGLGFLMCVFLLPVTGRADIIPGDMNLDGDVDWEDVTAFLDCMQGTEIPVAGTCRVGDTDLDLDVDLVNFADLQVNFTGPL